MRKLILERLYRPDGTFGFMSIDSKVISTVERPWLYNKPFESCIPEGQYECVRDFYDKGSYDCIKVLNVPDRTEILFHKANKPEELAGCIAPNSQLSFQNGLGKGVDSAGAFNILMDWFGGMPFLLDIRKG